MLKRLTLSFAAALWLIMHSGAAPAAEAEPQKSAPVEKPAAPRALTGAEKLAKTASEWRALAAKKKLAAEAEKDEDKKKVFLDAAARIEEIAVRTAQQAADEQILEANAGVRKARAAEAKASRELREAQAALEKVREEIRALDGSTDAATREKAAEFQKRVQDFQNKENALAAVRKKRLETESKILQKAAAKGSR